MTGGKLLGIIVNIILFPVNDNQMKVKSLILTSLLAALTAVGAWIKIPLPFTNVPLTLQVFFVLLAGLILGPLWGPLSQIIYILLGCAGLPVFAGGTSGLGVLLGPTGGYLIGFIVAAFLIGGLSRRWPQKNWWLLVVLLSGLMVIYLFGLVQYMLVVELSLEKAFLAGVLPFIPLDLVKLSLSLWVARRLSQLGFILD